MRVQLNYRERLVSLGQFLVDELDQLVASIRTGWGIEHTAEGGHSHITAETVTMGRLTFNDIVVPESLVVEQVHNYNPDGLDTASVLRLGVFGSFNEVSITGLQVPLDEAGHVIDGRILVIENNDATSTIVLENEHTGSFPRNRFIIPWRPAETNISARVHLNPGSLTVVMYNAVRARWVIESRSNEEIVSYTEFAANVDNFLPTGFRASKVIRLVPLDPLLTISGFNVQSDVPVPCKKTIVNEGLYAFSILHANTASLVGNRVYCPGGVRYQVHPLESIELYLEVDGTWHILQKATQWIDVAFDAGNFTATTGAWTLTSADQLTLNYHLDGNRMTVAFSLITTTLSLATVAVSFTVPRGLTIARTVFNTMGYSDNGTQGTGIVRASVGTNVLRLVMNIGETTNWAASTNLSSFTGEITFMVVDTCATIAELHTDVTHGDAAHSDADHTDVTHIDTAHVDSHSDASHADSSHTDVAHADTHSDVAHSDVAHSDVTHIDTAHTDSAHSDVTHTDVHGDEHGDGIVGGGDFTHVDTHEDTHSDIAHEDTEHGDGAHSDTAHVDVAHSDSHTDTHDDVAHSDSAHSDSAHSDSHSDSPFSDTAHIDGGHGDTEHGDTPHEDVGRHCDTAHADV